MDLIKIVEPCNRYRFLDLNRRLLLLSVMTDMDPQQLTLTCLQVQNQLEQTRVSFLAFQCS